MRKKNSTTIRFTPKAEDLVKKLADALGVTKTAVIEMAVRKLAEKEKVS